MMLRKLQNVAGETLAEALVALLIVGLATSLFVGVTTTSQRLNLAQKDNDADFYSCMEEAELLQGTGEDVNIKVTWKYNSEQNEDTISCKLVNSSGELFAYYAAP